jgi:hypothetical protein
MVDQFGILIWEINMDIVIQDIFPPVQKNVFSFQVSISHARHLQQSVRSHTMDI